MGGCSCTFPYCEPILSFIKRSSKKRRKVCRRYTFIYFYRERQSRLAFTPSHPRTAHRQTEVSREGTPSPGFTRRVRVRLPPALPQCWTCPPIQAKLMGRHCHGCLPVRLVTSRVSDQFPRSSRSGRSVSWCVALSRSWQAARGLHLYGEQGGKQGRIGAQEGQCHRSTCRSVRRL